MTKLIRAISSKKHLWHISELRSVYSDHRTLCGRTIKHAWVAPPNFTFFPLRCPACAKLGDFDAIIAKLNPASKQDIEQALSDAYDLLDFASTEMEKSNYVTAHEIARARGQVFALLTKAKALHKASKELDDD